MESNNKKRVLSGIRATGRLHLGNYLGAVKGMVELQDNPEYETYYMVADAHAITTPYDVKNLEQNRKDVVLDYLAAGLDPKKSVIFIQSQVPAHFELMHYLSSVVTISRMQHLPTFKEKVKQYPEEASMALLNYPILMAADILAYKATDVPVGEDQEPHLEVARLIARKMNDKYGTDFPEPTTFKTAGSYVPSLLGEGKMSKSVEGSYINLTDDLDTIKDRLAKVPTDSGMGTELPKSGSIANLLYFIEIFQGEEKKKEYEASYLGSGIRYRTLKNELAVAIYEHLKPIQERRKEFEGKIDKILEEGSKKANETARNTLAEVRQKMGF